MKDINALIEEVEKWGENMTAWIMDILLSHEKASIHAGLANSILLGFLADGKQEFLVSSAVIEEYKNSGKGIHITCHGTDENGMVRYTIEMFDTKDEKWLSE